MQDWMAGELFVPTTQYAPVSVLDIVFATATVVPLIVTMLVTKSSCPYPLVPPLVNP
jgi:hypothetical protein